MRLLACLHARLGAWLRLALAVYVVNSGISAPWLAIMFSHAGNFPSMDHQHLPFQYLQFLYSVRSSRIGWGCFQRPPVRDDRGWLKLPINLLISRRGNASELLSPCGSLLRFPRLAEKYWMKEQQVADIPLRIKGGAPQRPERRRMDRSTSYLDINLDNYIGYRYRT